MYNICKQSFIYSCIINFISIHSATDTSIEKDIFNGFPNEIFKDLGLKFKQKSEILSYIRALILKIF